MASVQKEAEKLQRMKKSGDFEQSKLALDVEAYSIRNGFKRDIMSFGALSQGFKAEPRAQLVAVFSGFEASLRSLD